MIVRVSVSDQEGTVFDTFETEIDVVADNDRIIAREAVLNVAESIRFGVL